MRKHLKKLVQVGIYLMGVTLFLLFLTKNPIGNVVPIKHAIEPSIQKLQELTEKIAAIEGRNAENPPALKKAAELVKAEWENQGYKVEEQKYKLKNVFKEEVEVTNLMISYNSDGTDQQKTITIGAHYDVYSGLPGADDNASGVAGLLELTRLVMKEKPKTQYRIDFVAYTLEEPPYYDTEMMGSYVHAKLMKELNRKISLMVSLEMIGYFSDEENSQNYPIPYLNKLYPNQANFIAIAGELKEWFIIRKVKSYFQTMTDLPVATINTTKYMEGIDWSDHRSYWTFGYPALMITDTSFLRNKNYHKNTDTAEKLDYKKMAKVVLGTYGIISQFSE